MNDPIGVIGGSGLYTFLDDVELTDVSTPYGDPSGPLATGDLAVATEPGPLRFVGRADDVIKVAGENVSLTEIEAIISQAPGVLEAAVVARPDPVRDHVPVAYVVPRDAAAPPDSVALADWAATELPPQARPREWHIIAELPRTSVGKVRRFQLPNPAEVPDPPTSDG